MEMLIPVLIVVLSNILYHICTKSVPQQLNIFASLTVTYTVAAVSSLAFFLLTQHGGLADEYRKLNWSSFALGLAIIGLESGFILMYKVGWDISTGQLVASAILAVALIFVGIWAYNETLTAQKLIGIAVCMLGLFLINK